ncbi:MAG: DNA topoisomerase IB [Chloroflexota bacterium]|nr:DNA topoisomerase IB [Chloroflexota bacterium]
MALALVTDAPRTGAQEIPTVELRQRGWRREGDKEHGFRYLNARGQLIKSQPHIERIHRLRIPPAWRDVRISPSFHTNLQATGLDDAGRKQYIYHPDFVARQAARKFDRLGLFATKLPQMRSITSEHLGEETDPTESRIMATMVRLINEAYFRVGSEEYAKRHKTYGITTLLKHHVRLENRQMVFEYTGKRGIRQNQVITDGQLYEIMERLMGLPGKRMFQYFDEHGELRPANGHELNAYIKRVMSAGLSAKDFRTWGGTLLAAETLAELGPSDSEKQAKKNIVEAVKHVAQKLGNTPAVARSSYISPVVFERYLQGKTLEGYVRRAEKTIHAKQLDYDPEELALVRLLGLKVPLVSATINHEEAAWQG